MKKLTACLPLIMLFATISSAQPVMQPKTQISNSGSATDLRITLNQTMRKVWEEHVTWTRNVILCLVDDLPGTAQAESRLLQNQTDIGNVFKTYYGDDAGNHLTTILMAHINISFEVIKASKTKNTAALDEANKRWYANADELSAYLCKLNHAWALIDMKMMMKEHLQITTDEAEQRLVKNYDGDVMAFDKINARILLMADMFSDGIVKQFPEKFEPIANK